MLCERCGREAIGYATIGRKRYCHADERSCYTEQHREENREWIAQRVKHASDRSVLAIAAENAIRWKDALDLLGRDHARD